MHFTVVWLIPFYLANFFWDDPLHFYLRISHKSGLFYIASFWETSNPVNERGDALLLKSIAFLYFQTCSPTTDLEPCQEFIFDRRISERKSLFEDRVWETSVTEMSHVCDHSWKNTIITCSTFIGYMIGSVVGGNFWKGLSLFSYKCMQCL